MEQDSSVFVDDGLGDLCPEQHSSISGGDGGSLGLHTKLVGGKDGNVPWLQVQLLGRLCRFYDG